MRISALPADPGYRSDFHRYVVFLDGAIVDRVVTADNEAGIVIFNDAAIIPGRAPSEITLCGHVEIMRHAGGRWTNARRQACGHPRRHRREAPLLREAA